MANALHATLRPLRVPPWLARERARRPGHPRHNPQAAADLVGSCSTPSPATTSVPAWWFWTTPPCASCTRSGRRTTPSGSRISTSGICPRQPRPERHRTHLPPSQARRHAPAHPVPLPGSPGGRACLLPEPPGRTSTSIFVHAIGLVRIPRAPFCCGVDATYCVKTRTVNPWL